MMKNPRITKADAAAVLKQAVLARSEPAARSLMTAMKPEARFICTNRKGRLVNGSVHQKSVPFALQQNDLAPPAPPARGDHVRG
jgi:hypothetical protein